MIEWLDDFYKDPDLKQTLLRNFTPVFESYINEAVGPVDPEFVQSLAETYVEGHLDSSRAQLQEVVKGSENPLADLVQRFEEWEAKRPGKVAKNELVRSANAATVEQMRTTGVTKIKWRTVGSDTCSFCRSLNDTVISVDGTFFKEGDELNPEGATAPIHFESSIGHPPIHQGCVCTVESGFVEENVAKWGQYSEAQIQATLDSPKLTNAQTRAELLEALHRKRFVPPARLPAPQRLPSRPRGQADRATVAWARELWGTRTGPFYSSLTKAQMEAASRYSGSDYRIVNRILRKGTAGTPAARRRIDALQEAINLTPLDRDIVVTRGTTLSAFDRYHPKTFIGKEIMEPGFMSTSTKAQESFIGFDHAVRLNITAPQGTRALYMEPVTTVKGENEILFGHGTRMRVNAVTERKIRGRTEYVVDVEIVGP